MINLSEILLENDSFDNQKIDEFDNLLKTKLTNVGKNLLYRGVRNYINGPYIQKIPPINRKSRDTIGIIHEFIERIRINDYNGEPISRVNNAFFASPLFDDAQEYGKVYIVFIPKEYKAMYSTVDPTEEYFSDLSVYWLLFFNGLQKFKDFYDKELKDSNSLRYIFNFANEYDNSDKIISLEPLRELKNIVDNFINDNNSSIDSFDSLNYISKGVNQIINVTDSYFADLIEAKAPWVTQVDMGKNDKHYRLNNKKIYEIIIECEYYYLVDIDWFTNNFEFDSELNGYRKK
jgi:hypothetical protein